MVENPKTKTDETKNKVDEIDLEAVLLELGKQGKVSISRAEPEWCKGHVRTVPIQGSEPITIEWIAKNFGGSVLHVRIYGSGSGPLRAFRQIEIAGPPKDGYGIEVVRGPDGEPVPITRIGEVRRRYNQLHGIDDPSDYRAPPQQEQAPKFDLSAVLQTMIQAQNTQNQTMISMLVSRISSLEGLLQNQVQQGPQALPVQQIDPLNSLKNTVDTIAQLERIKDAMGIGDRDREPEGEIGIYTSLIKGFMDIELEKRRAQVAQIQAQSQARPPQAPPRALPQPVPSQPLFPQPQAPAPPAAAPKETQDKEQDRGGLDSEQLKDAMARIEKLDRAERLQLASLVLGEPIDDGDDDYEDEDDHDTVNMKNGFPGRQTIENALNSSYSDETGNETTGSADPECSEPNSMSTPKDPYGY